MKKWTKLSRNGASRKRNEIQGKSGQNCPETKKMNCPEKETKYKEKVDKVVQKRKKMVSRKETKHKEQVDKVVTLFINVKLDNDSSKSKYTRPSFFL